MLGLTHLLFIFRLFQQYSMAGLLEDCETSDLRNFISQKVMNFKITNSSKLVLSSFFRTMTN